jgi:hypothetical protein
MHAHITVYEARGFHGGDHRRIRAFTTSAVAVANGASSIVMVRTVWRRWHFATAGLAIATRLQLE